MDRPVSTMSNASTLIDPEKCLTCSIKALRSGRTDWVTGPGRKWKASDTVTCDSHWTIPLQTGLTGHPSYLIKAKVPLEKEAELMEHDKRVKDAHISSKEEELRDAEEAMTQFLTGHGIDEDLIKAYKDDVTGEETQVSMLSSISQ